MVASKQSQDGTQFHPDSAWKRNDPKKLLRQSYPPTKQTFFKWFIPVVCDYNIKYQNDIRWVSQNTTLYTV